MLQTNFRDGAIVALGSLLLWLSANYHFFWPLVLVGLIPLLAVIYRAQVQTGLRIFVLSWLSGFIYLGGIFLWVFATLPLDWVGNIPSSLSYLLATYTWFAPTIVMSFFIALWGYAFFRLKRNNWSDIFLSAFLWVIVEYTWAYIFSILAYGPGGIIGLTWTTGFLGYNIASSVFILPLAYLGGIWLLTFMVVSINGLLFFIWRRVIRQPILSSRTLIKLSGLLLFIILGGYFWQIYRLSQTDYSRWRTGVVTTYTPSYSQVTPLEIEEVLKKKQHFFTTNFSQKDSTLDLIIFPEDNRFLQYLSENHQQDFVQKLYGDREVLLIDSARSFNKSGSPNLQITYVNTKNGDFALSGKKFLTPHGEYLPYFSDWFLGAIGLGEWVADFKNVRSNLPGEYSSGILFKGVHFEATACSDIMMPNLYRDIVDRGAEVLINPGSHSLFRGSNILYNQTLNMAKVRAVEANRYFIYPSNFMPSFVVDNRGSLVAQAPIDSQMDSVLYTDISLIKEKSFYHHWSKLLPFWLVFGLLSIYTWRNRKNLISD